jgi:hypothetical protein
MSKSVNNNAVFFLIAVLVAGIIAISFQSFIDTEASGDKRGDHHNKHKDYKSKDPSVIVKKITCNNFNVNINGLSMDISPDDIASDLVAQAQADNNDNNEDISANSLGNSEKRNNLYEDNHDFDGFIYICIDNINAQDSSAQRPVPPSDETTSDETTSDETTSDEKGTSETTTTDEQEQQGSEAESKDNVSGETPYIQIPPSTDETPADETPTEGTPYPPTPPSTETTTDETPSDETTTESEETVTQLKNFLAKMRS